MSSHLSFASEQPDLSKPFSRWDAPYWAMMHGVCGALSGDARWTLLAALYSHLPNVNPGLTRLAQMTGLSVKTVKRVRKSLRAAGAIQYADHAGGSHEDRTQYELADVRHRDIAAKIIAKVQASVTDGGHSVPRSDGGHGDPGTGDMASPHGGHSDPRTGVIMTPKVIKGSSQGSTQEKDPSGAASPPAGSAGSPAGVASSAPVTTAGQAHGSTACGTSAKGSKKRSKGVGRARPGGLTDEQKRSVCSSTLNMMAYLVHGSDAIGKPMDDWRELEPGAMHWAPAGRDLRTPEPGVGVPALAAYYWVQVCRARLKVNVPMALPDVGKLTATVKTLRGRMTHEDLVQLIDDVTKRWPEVTSALSWMSSPPQLDELTLHSRHVVEVAKRLASGQSIHKPAPVVGVGTSEENENLIKERYANLF